VYNEKLGWAVRVSFSVMFIFDARNFHSRRIWYEKPAPKTGARKWSRFMAPVSSFWSVCHGP